MSSGLFEITSPFFSIIIPTYNSGKTLSECLKSIYDQSFQNYEVIIIDSASNDNTIDIIKHFKEINLNINWVSEKDCGVYDALNKGVKLTKGKWIYFLGSDDTLFDHKVLENIFSRTKDEIDVIYGNVKVHGNTNWATDGSVYDREFNLNKLISKNICHQSIFYNKDCFLLRPYPFNINYKICGDWDFNLFLWKTKKFQYVNLIIANFYSGGESSREIKDEIFKKDFIKNISYYFGSEIAINIDSNFNNKIVNLTSNQVYSINTWIKKIKKAWKLN